MVWGQDCHLPIKLFTSLVPRPSITANAVEVYLMSFYVEVLPRPSTVLAVIEGIAFHHLQ